MTGLLVALPVWFFRMISTRRNCINKVLNPETLHSEQFPSSNKYDPKWIFENQMGPNPLWLTEFLVQPFELKPDMRLLDLGCGKGRA